MLLKVSMSVGELCLKSWCHETLVCVCELQWFLFLGHTLCASRGPRCTTTVPCFPVVSVPSCVTALHLRVAWHPRVPDRHTLTHSCGVCISCSEPGVLGWAHRAPLWLWAGPWTRSPEQGTTSAWATSSPCLSISSEEQ